jgi:hypothetical protein
VEQYEHVHRSEARAVDRVEEPHHRAAVRPRRVRRGRICAPADMELSPAHALVQRMRIVAMTRSSAPAALLHIGKRVQLRGCHCAHDARGRPRPRHGHALVLRPQPAVLGCTRGYAVGAPPGKPAPPGPHGVATRARAQRPRGRSALRTSALAMPGSIHTQRIHARMGARRPRDASPDGRSAGRRWGTV